MQTINREQLKEKMQFGSDFVLVEVLPAHDYERFHLPGAMNIPAGPDFEAKATHAIPNKSQTVVVYCSDSECDASAVAAARLEALGYRDVQEYAAGKVDWQQSGLPVESSHTRGPAS